MMIANDSTYNCLTCKVKYKGDQKKQAQHQELKGCFQEQSFLVAKSKNSKEFSMLPKVKFTKCPMHWIDSSYMSLFQMHSEWKAGSLHFEGNALSQPSKYYEAMTFIDTLKTNNQLVREEILKNLNKTRAARGK